ncbi:MAG TPA: LytTR family transcriptional regulator DNA-binding domain-containing protein [Bryobacteraceae bacterium]|jgi:two-component system, LytTR family, response regulator|nr:LytTR family transcriptional regulator DNA-binding domain-containing protein [Bryobacteraceae bacterium]
MRAFLVDDEALAVKRLQRMLAATKRVDVVGTSTDPVEAVAAILEAKPDVLFLDIEMPGMTGFEMLAHLQPQPWVVFTTAYDRYALEAFGVNSVDYLLKPIEAAPLDRALDKIERLHGSSAAPPELRELIARLATVAGAVRSPSYPDRVASRVGERIEFIDLVHVTHFFAADKLTFAATGAKNYAVDYTIQELEQKLDPAKFVRIHRASLVNVEHVQELHSWFAGKMMLRLKDPKHTELSVSRDRVRALKERLGI